MAEGRSLTGLLADFRLLLILFVSFRLLLLLAYPPFLVDGAERGIGTGGDRVYHYALTALAADDLLPFRDWWSEFPPLWYLTTTLVYLALGSSATYDNWALALGLLVLLTEAGNLLLLRRIGTRLHGPATGMALAWVYALLVAPAIFMWWNFDTLVTFFLLGGLWALLQQRDTVSAGWVAAGALTKFVPLLLFGAVVRFRPARRAARYIALVLALCLLAYLPLLALNAPFALISLTAQFDKPSYQTVWALLDGNYSTGNFGTIASHLTAAGVRDGVSDKNPPVIPAVVRLGVAAALGLLVFGRTRRFDAIGLVAFVGITFVLFYLQSQGWSPQWLAQILPLLLLVFPTRDGVLLAVMLSLLAFVEYPFLFIRTGDSGGAFVPGSPLFAPWALVIVLRTALLAGVAALFYGKLRQQGIPD
ncbi:MAG: hypothetical protein MUE40_12460 [Anaerolineae bacterium]|nr:hypothetical protein [Anaerolineae bacterium]